MRSRLGKAGAAVYELAVAEQDLNTAKHKRFKSLLPDYSCKKQENMTIYYHYADYTTKKGLSPGLNHRGIIF